MLRHNLLGRHFAAFTILMLAVVAPSPKLLMAADLSAWSDFPARELGESGRELVAKLTSTITRHNTALRRSSGECSSSDVSDCRFQNWWAAFGSLKGLQDVSRVAMVNELVNELPFVEDSENWDTGDYWATPSEFYGRGGDCEDYVIMKYLALRRLGFEASQLRVSVVKRPEFGDIHAVLVVKVADELLVLDNLSADLMPWPRLQNRYQPVYSVNEVGSWLHGLS